MKERILKGESKFNSCMRCKKDDNGTCPYKRKEKFKNDCAACSEFESDYRKTKDVKKVIGFNYL